MLVTSSAESRAHVQHLLHPGLLQLPACMVEVAVLLQAAIASTVPLPHLACAQQHLASAKCYTETTRRLQPTALSLTAAYSSFDAASCKMLQQLSAAFCLSACIVCFSPFFDTQRRSTCKCNCTASDATCCSFTSGVLVLSLRMLHGRRHTAAFLGGFSYSPACPPCFLSLSVACVCVCLLPRSLALCYARLNTAYP